jgi:glycosyltransferase involved in cell wall biosynthesis
VALATCLAQDFDNYEIVVCDNASDPETRAVVDAARSERITYHRTDRPLAMSANWELAVSMAEGEYVTVVGDDDALMPYALRELDRLIVEHQRPPAVNWRRAVYTWPTISVRSDANLLFLPLTRACTVFDGRQRLAMASRWEIGADQLPMIYCSVVRNDLIEKHRNIAGCVFPSIYPDVYSAYAFAYLAESYVFIEVPMGVAGLSAASNGVATLVENGTSPIAIEFNELNRAAGFRPHPTVPDLNLVSIHPDDCFQHARDLLFPDDPHLALDRRRMAERYLAGITETNPKARADARAAIRRSLQDRPDLLEWFDTEAPDPPPAAPYRIRPPRLGYFAGTLSLDASRFGVSDVADAVRLAQDLLGVSDDPIDYVRI